MHVASTVGVVIALLISGTALAETVATDEAFANAALHELHSLAAASWELAHATRDADDLGCQYANSSAQEAAHNALENMHFMSFEPTDAVRFVSALLRTNHLAPLDRCSSDGNSGTGIDLGLLTAGQAIMALRWDYAIGDANWYKLDSTYDINGENPLRYAQSLNEQNYSWVDVRPKGMLLVVEPDWTAEMNSSQVGDPSIQYSGDNLQVVEVGYRKNSGDNVSTVTFYRTKQGATAAAQAEKQQVEDDARAAAAKNASEAEWKRKLASLPFAVANHDVGFRLIYGSCKPTNDKCNNNEFHDWSDSNGVPYRWFSDKQQCQDVLNEINADHPPDVTPGPNDAFLADCVPAPKASGRNLKGYQMIIAITPSSNVSDQTSYITLRGGMLETPLLFKTLSNCYNKIDATYLNIENYLGLSPDGTRLSDATKSVMADAYCVHIY